MALYKIKDFVSEYDRNFADDDIIGYELYSNTEKIGKVDNILVDDEGHFRYLVANTGILGLGKSILLPVGYARIDYDQHRVYADHLSKEQVEALPKYDDGMTVDFHHEESVRKVYRQSQEPVVLNRAGAGVGYGGIDTAPVSNNSAPVVDLTPGYDGYDHQNYSYDRDPNLYQLKDESLKQRQQRFQSLKMTRTI
ncbi:MAG: hypothetical protein N5P05_001770 [Chroococcopsis gigantea SAG 12.99]|jgi:hypothetical protein|nr:hypothetical protein [Chroococcopsis gigantea SAG 12.99]